MNQTNINVIVADDHEVFLSGFAAVFHNTGINVVATALNGEQLLHEVRTHQPHVVITDVKMPVMDGEQATRIIKKEFPQIKVLAFSAFDETVLIEDMNEAGAAGYVLKNTPKEELIAAIKALNEGRNFYCSQTEKKLAQIEERKPLPLTIEFSPRELEVLNLLCRGYSNKEVGRALDIHSRTVEFHRKNLYTKAGVASLAQLAIFAVEHGLI